MFTDIERKSASASEVDAGIILQDLYDYCEHNDPLGVSVLLVHPGDFSGDREEVERRYMRLFENYLGPEGRFRKSASVQIAARESGLTLPTMAGYALDWETKCNKARRDTVYHIMDNSPCCHVFRSGYRFQEYANNYDPKKYRAPVCAVIVAADTDMSAIVSEALDIPVREVPEYPVARSASGYANVWHEIGHAAGAGEAQAEKIASIMYRKAFADVAALQVRADLRFAQPVIGYRNETILEKYGWYAGKVIDDVTGWNEASIASLGESDVKAVRFENFESRVVEACLIGTMLEEEVGNKRSLSEYADVAASLASQGTFGDKGSGLRRVADRFVLATRRLSTGTPAYAGPGAARLAHDP